jgi:alcohol dehydrogenase
MRAAVLEDYGEPLRLADVDRPSPAPHGAVVAVDACGLCRSDWHAWRGHGEWADDQVPLGQVLGHEPAGQVIETGEEVTEISVGEEIAIPFSMGEGGCRYCRRGRGNLCVDGYALGFEPAAPGAFAEFVHVPHADFNAARLPNTLAPRAAAALGCRYATAFHGLAHRVRLTAGDWVVVMGCGGLGLSAVQIAHAMGASVVAVDLSSAALERAAALGATQTITGGEEETVADQIKDVTDGGAHISIDAVGREETCRTAVSSLQPGGTHLQLGLTGTDERGQIPLPTDRMTRWERSFVGARGCPPSRYEELLRFVNRGAVDPGELVSRELQLGDISERLVAMDEFGTHGIEVVTDFGG